MLFINKFMIQSIFGSKVLILNNTKELLTNETYNEIITQIVNTNSVISGHSYTRGGKVYTTDLKSIVKDCKKAEISNLISRLKEHGEDYIRLSEKDYSQKLQYHTCTVNLCYTGAEIINHTDTRDDADGESLTVLYYPKVPKDSGNLVFMHNSKFGEWASDSVDKDTVKIELRADDIVIFDNYTLHAVGTHKSTEARMSIHTQFDIVEN